MRRVLGETARRKPRVKHRGEFRRVPMTEHAIAEPDDDLRPPILAVLSATEVYDVSMVQRIESQKG
jgi:hypothetical protein